MKKILWIRFIKKGDKNYIIFSIFENEKFLRQKIFQLDIEFYENKINFLFPEKAYILKNLNSFSFYINIIND